VYLRSAQKYYSAIFELMDWQKADMRCRELGPYSRLVDIDDDTENMAVKQFIESFDGNSFMLLCPALEGKISNATVRLSVLSHIRQHRLGQLRSDNCCVVCRLAVSAWLSTVTCS